MKHELKKIFKTLPAAVLSLSLLTACTSPNPSDKAEEPKVEQETSEEQTSADTSDTSNVYDFPTMGLTVKLPDALIEHMEQESVSMFIYELPVEDNSALQYGYLGWYPISNTQDEQNFYPGEMQSIGILGVYQSDLVSSLDELTGCDKHQELGQSADGAYKYYLSINTSADAALIEELEEIQTTITEMTDYESYSDEAMEQQPKSDVSSVGDFTTQDVNGNTVTQDIFKEYDLTMVNIFTTWCSPCVSEMPDLEMLYQQMKDKNVGVVGVVLDVLNEKGEIVEEDLERAQLLVQKTGVTYPVILPDSTYLNGRLTSIEAFPETFFVDKNGNIVGETYSGSGSLEDWLETVEKELANLEKGA